MNEGKYGFTLWNAGKWIVTGLALVLFLGMVIRAEAGYPVKLVINGKEVSPDVPLTIIEGRTMAPVRFLAETIGYEVTWDDTTQTVYLNGGGSTTVKNSVPVAPNKSIAAGKVLGYSQISSELLNMKPQQTIYAIDLLVTEANDVPGYANFVERNKGQVIKVYSKQPLPADFYGKTIGANVSYTGDERGGSYWLNEIAD